MAILKKPIEVDDLINNFKNVIKQAKEIETRDDKEAAKAELVAKIKRDSVERAKRVRAKIEELFS